MSEPVMRRTQSGQAENLFRSLQSPLAKTLSLCTVLSALAFTAVPAQAESAAPSAAVYSIESAKAKQSLLVDVAKAGTRLVAVGERGHILFSDDDGAQWQQAKVPSRVLLTSVYFSDDKHGWAVGHDATILASTDGGATWVEQMRDIEREEGAPFLDVWFKDSQLGFVVGAYGALLQTTDGGASWEEVGDRLDNEDGFHLNAIAAVKDAGLVVVGEMGVMFRSADDGQTWERLTSPYEGTLFGALGTAESSSLLAFGLRGNMFRSADFGSSWEPVRIQSGNNGLEVSLSGASLQADGSIVVVGNGGVVLKSTDGGRSFAVAGRPDRLSLAGVAANAQGNLILVGQGGVRVASPTGLNLGQQ